MHQDTYEWSAEQGGMGRVTESDRYRLLSSARRRDTLDVLADGTVPIELGDLATAVAARADGVDGTDEDAIEQVRGELHHVHLPKLDAFDVVDYDPERRRVEARSDAVDSLRP